MGVFKDKPPFGSPAFWESEAGKNWPPKITESDIEVSWHYKEKERLYKRITTLEHQVVELVIIIDTLIKRKGERDE